MNARLAKQTLVAATLVTVGGNILGRLFGYFREAVIANYFGTSAILDLFLIAAIVPEILTFVIFAALPTSVIRTSSGQSDTPDEAALFWKGLYACAAFFGLVSIAVYLARFSLIDLIAPQLSPENVMEAARLLALLAPFVFFRSLEAYFRAWLFRSKHFIAPSLSPFVLDGVIIVWIWLGYDTLNIESLAYGWLASSVVLFLIHAVAVGVILKPGRPGKESSASVGPLVKMTIGVMAVESLSLLYPAIDRYLAVRYLGVGEIAALRYALFLSQVPPGMLVVTFAAAAFPWISDMATAQPEKLVSFYRETLRLVVYVMTPMAAALIVFAPEVVSAAFRRGAFDQQSVMLTSGPLLCYSLGLIFYGIYFYQIRFYYARSLLMRLGVILGSTLLFKLVASVILVQWLSANGLALATSLAWLATSVIMTIDLGRGSGLTLSRDISGWLVRLVVSIAGACGVWLLMRKVWTLPLSASLLHQFTWLIVIGLLGAVAYFGLSLLMHMPEPRRVFDTLKNRFESRSGSPH
ncbi:MAG: oligosaccharide flippase family protein [candidate division Zixibacteria bacterium]|nr:oligosaccharide flippase family protein [candidate division Zixibacteria bacterium]